MFETREEALANEFMVKGWRRSKKEALVAGEWQEIVRQASIRADARQEMGAGAMTTEIAPQVHPTRTSG
jgi:hypothetical protein